MSHYRRSNHLWRSMPRVRLARDHRHGVAGRTATWPCKQAMPGTGAGGPGPARGRLRLCRLACGFTRAAAGSRSWCCCTASARPATSGAAGGPCSSAGGRTCPVTAAHRTGPFLSATAHEGDLRLIRAPNSLLAGCAAGRDHDEVSHGKEKADNGLVTQVAPEWTIRALLRCEISSAAAAQNRRSGQRHGASTNKSGHAL